MKLTISIRFFLIGLMIIIHSNPIYADEEKEMHWTGTLVDGTVIDEHDLKRIIEKSQRTTVAIVKADGKLRIGANNRVLVRADLSGADLSNTDLQGINLAGSIFRGANLENAILRDANLDYSCFQNAYLNNSDFENASLKGAEFDRASIFKVNFQDACLPQSDFRKANIINCNFRNANLTAALLQNAKLIGSNFKNATFEVATLDGASVYDTNFNNTGLYGASLKDVSFEFDNNGIPNMVSTAMSHHLYSLKFNNTPHSLIAIRNEFKNMGLRKLERQMTYAIRHSSIVNALNGYGSILTKAGAIIEWILFESTCKWGMAPFRPLFILFILIFVFMLPYIQAISGELNGKEKTDGIWKEWIPERKRQDLGTNEGNKPLDSINPFFCIKMGFYFSLLSAFNIGWRELNVGNWIARIHPQEYGLKATGWVRTVSGMQSIISVYLLALTVLTYFGRPFEGY